MTKLLPLVQALSAGTRERLLRRLTPIEAAAWNAAWDEWAHKGQREPDGEWRTWVMMAGRGFGKTRAGAEWVHALVREARRAGSEPLSIALVAATVEEGRRVMVEGSSGLLAVTAHPSERPRFEPSLRRVLFPGGSEAILYSGAHPEGLRGPQHHFAWCDELAKWRYPGKSWDMLQLGLRCGEQPRTLVTTTPRAGLGALKRILADAKQTGGASGVNPHLPEAYLRAIASAYGGTGLGRQEIDGVLAADVDGSLWPAALIEACRGEGVSRERLRRVVIGVDPPASAEGVCGIVACGLDEAGMGHVLADHSAGGLSPEGWALRVAAAVEAHGADRVIAEKNQGGDMVRTVLMSAGQALPIRLVSASRGKVARAEPVAALFESGQVRLAGRFDELEAELAGLVAGGDYAGLGRSPDRADAMVWALWALMVERRGEAGVRLP